MADSAVASVVVYGLGSLGRGGATPVKLALAGAAMAALLSSLTSAILLLDVTTLDQFRFCERGGYGGGEGRGGGYGGGGGGGRRYENNRY